MLARLATFLHAHGGRILIGAVICALVAGAFGVGVSNSLWPYSAKDPSTESVKARAHFEASTPRQIDAGVVALVSSGDVGTTAARQRVDQVAAQLRGEPNIAGVQSFYTTHNPSMVSRDRQATYVLGYFKPLPTSPSRMSPSRSRTTSPASATSSSAARQWPTLR
jgi:hypothetical protein